MNYAKTINNVPQTTPIPGMNQVKNNAGGFVFKTSEMQQLERFLVLGTIGGTFYVGEQKLTVENANVIINLIKKDGLTVLMKLMEVVENNKAIKHDPVIFVLSLLATHGNQDTKLATYSVIPRALKTSTHLFNFINNIHELRGWSRGLRTAVSNFYLTKTPEQVAYQLAKYRQRNGMTHRDVLRLAHPKTTDSVMFNTLGYAVGKVKAVETGNKLLQAVEKSLASTDEKEVAKLVTQNNLTWEMVPTEMLNSKVVQAALLPKMPLNALLRNLNRYTISGLFDGRTGEFTQMAVAKLTSETEIAKANLHPINIMNTLKVYSQGRGDKSSKTWTPNQAIVDALSDLFELSFKAITPTNKKILVGVDVSGSMSTGIAGLSLSASESAAVLAMTYLRTEPNAEVILFDTDGYLPTFSKRSSYKEVFAGVNKHGGGTDCSIPYIYANVVAHNQKKRYDAVVVVTDSETWAGRKHPVTAYNELQPGVKNILVATTATSHSLVPDDMPNTLAIAGFDASTPEVIASFLQD